MVVPNWHHHEIYVTAPNHQNSATRKAYVDYHINDQINGDRAFHNNKITGLKAGTDDTDSINKKQLDDGLALKANKTDTMQPDINRNWDANGKQIFNLNQNFNSDVIVPDIGYV